MSKVTVADIKARYAEVTKAAKSDLANARERSRTNPAAAEEERLFKIFRARASKDFRSSRNKTYSPSG